jgi:hypothetical protein
VLRHTGEEILWFLAHLALAFVGVVVAATALFVFLAWWFVDRGEKKK